MKQIFNKFFLGTLFILGFGFLFIPSHDVNAKMLADVALNGGGGGGSGGGTTTVTTPAYGTISLTVSPDKTTPYTASTNMVVSSTASVAVCSNTSLNLRVTGNITGPSTLNVGTLLDQKVVGGQVLAGNSTIVVPATPGDYVFNITATRYDQEGYVLNESSRLIASASSYIVKIGGSVFYIDTNYRGRITKIKTNGMDIPIDTLLYGTPTADNGTPLYISPIGEDVIKTYSTSFNFSVVAPVTTTGSWSYSSSCPSACGTAQSTQTQTCTGGNGSCSGTAGTRPCNATEACPPVVITPDLKATSHNEYVWVDNSDGPLMVSYDPSYAGRYGQWYPFTLSWNAIPNATSCQLDYSYNITDPSVAGSVTWQVATWTGRTHTFDLVCTGANGITGKDSVTLSYPPTVTNLKDTCSSDAKTVYISWTAPAGYNTFYTRGSSATRTDHTVDPGNGSTVLYHDDIVGTSDSFSINPNETVSWVVLAKAPNGAFGLGNGNKKSVTCVPTVATCSDGVKNQDETGIDIGGICATKKPDLTAGSVYPDYAGANIFPPGCTSATGVSTAGVSCAGLIYVDNWYVFWSTVKNQGNADYIFSLPLLPYWASLFQVASGPNGTGTISDRSDMYSSSDALTTEPNGSSTMNRISTLTTPLQINYDASILAGQTAPLAAHYSFNSIGTHSMRVCADVPPYPNGVINESNEKNNCGPWTNFNVISKEVSTTPTGTLSATNCTITTAGASTCVSKLTWTTSNLIAGKATAVTRDNPANTSVSTLTSGTNVSNTINHGDSTFYLYHNGAEPPLATKSVTASCDATLTWDTVSKTCVSSTVSGLATPTLGVEKYSCGDKFLLIMWTKSAGATSYKLYRDGVGPITIPNLDCSTISGYCYGNDEGLSLDTTYSYTVKASNASGDSAPSSAVSKTVPSACPSVPPTPLESPTGLSATPSSCGNAWLDISWNASVGASGYMLLKDTDSNWIYSGPNLSFKDTDVALGATHSYKVFAYNFIGGNVTTSTYSPVVPGIVANSCSVPPGGSVDGGWSDWTPVIKSCPSPLNPIQQTRTCTNPARANGGADCVGPSSQSFTSDKCPSITSFTIKNSSGADIINSIRYNTMVNIAWTSTNATSCACTSADTKGNVGPSCGNGTSSPSTQTLPLKKSMIYKLSCSGNGMTVSESKPVIVDDINTIYNEN